jgi:DNA polymerase III gamma/tau subunit
MTQETIITKYRPTSFDEVLGHDAVMETLMRAMCGDTCPHAFLLTGPSGTGKTTTARIIASTMGADVLEIDAASYAGVDDVRQLVEMGNHRSLKGSGTVMFLIDECHALSKAAWQALLKMLEEPPDHLYIALCTTEQAKVPATIVQRCFHVLLRPVAAQAIEVLLEAVADTEGWTVANDVLSEVVRVAQGSPRKALTTLQAVHGAESREEVARIIQLQEATPAVLNVVQYILKQGKDWETFKGLLAKVDDTELQSGLVEVCRYVIAWMLNSKSEKQASWAHDLLVDFTAPRSTYDARTLFTVAVCRMFWTECPK